MLTFNFQETCSSPVLSFFGLLYLIIAIRSDTDTTLQNLKRYLVNHSIATPTNTLRSISSVTSWTRSTRVSTDIGWRGKISARYTCVTRLTIELAGVNFAITESSRVSSLTCASHVNKFDVWVGRITLFWLHTQSTVLAGTHFNSWTPCRARSLFISSNEWQIKLKGKLRKP